jgi:hypothetical protein
VTKVERYDVNAICLLVIVKFSRDWIASENVEEGEDDAAKDHNDSPHSVA